jgi:nicotinamidase-related amidase
MQNGFCHPDGAAATRLDISAHRAIVPRVAALVEAAHDAGIPVFWSRQEHLRDDAMRVEVAFASDPSLRDRIERWPVPDAVAT